ncbi:hypothetical protein ACIBJE_29815 [Micromonospora sp. NPDC050187]|uniref:hypothetical protein n=1 Tax=Micromonospora sp. NPDC050187 TaxID=3364277 RepID=UPI0037BADBDA
MALRTRIPALAALGAITLVLGATPAGAGPTDVPAEEPPLLCLITTSTVAWVNGYQADITIKNKFGYTGTGSPTLPTVTCTRTG